MQKRIFLLGYSKNKFGGKEKNERTGIKFPAQSHIWRFVCIRGQQSGTLYRPGRKRIMGMVQ